MWCLKKYLIIHILTLAVITSQSLYNAYGLGLINSSNQISSKGVAGIGLVPAFRNNISLENPSTWQNLKFTILNSALTTQNIENNSGIKNGANELINVQIIIPIAFKYALGFSLEPLTAQRTFLRGDSAITVFENDSIYTYSEIRSGGGLSVFSTAFSWPLNNKIQLGLKLEYLFGSSRIENLFKVDNVNFRANNQASYKGLLLKSFLNGKIFEKEKFKVELYGSFQTTINALNGNKYVTQPFEDVNDNNLYDINDFPDSLAIDTLALRNIYSPTQINIGINLDLKNGLNLINEISWLKNSADNRTDLSILPDMIGEKLHFNFGIVKFPDGRIRDWYNRFNYRGGLYRTSHTLNISKSSIIESGYTLGIGIKFGAAGNQLDLAFKGGKRSIADKQAEKVKEFSVGLSLGDKWFLKRRAR